MNKKNSTSGLLKGMALGAMVATAVTIAITNKKDVSKKAKEIMNNTADSISSFIKTSWINKARTLFDPCFIVYYQFFNFVIYYFVWVSFTELSYIFR